ASDSSTISVDRRPVRRDPLHGSTAVVVGVVREADVNASIHIVVSECVPCRQRGRERGFNRSETRGYIVIAPSIASEVSNPTIKVRASTPGVNHVVVGCAATRNLCPPHIHNTPSKPWLRHCLISPVDTRQVIERVDQIWIPDR